MPTFTIDEAQARLPELIDRLAGGEVVITRGDAAVAKLVAAPGDTPPRGPRPGPGLCRGMIVIVEDDDGHLKDFAEYMP